MIPVQAKGREFLLAFAAGLLVACLGLSSCGEPDFQKDLETLESLRELLSLLESRQSDLESESARLDRLESRLADEKGLYGELRTKIPGELDTEDFLRNLKAELSRREIYLALAPAVEEQKPEKGLRSATIRLSLRGDRDRLSRFWSMRNNVMDRLVLWKSSGQSSEKRFAVFATIYAYPVASAPQDYELAGMPEGCMHEAVRPLNDRYDAEFSQIQERIGILCVKVAELEKRVVPRRLELEARAEELDNLTGIVYELEQKAQESYLKDL